MRAARSVVLPFGRYVRARRNAMGLSQRALAQRLAMDDAKLSRWETGRETLPPAKDFARIVKALGVAPEEILRATGYLPSSEGGERGAA